MRTHPLQWCPITWLKETQHYYFCSTDGKVSAGQSLCIGGLARAIAASTVIPFTVIKTRFEVFLQCGIEHLSFVFFQSGKYSYDSVHNALRSIWRTEGLRGVYVGCMNELFTFFFY